MGKFRKKRELISLDLTPLIDVVFLLLIFFMVSTTFTKYGEIDIEVPSSNVETEHKELPVELIIDENGDYFLSKEGKTSAIDIKNIANILNGIETISVTGDKNLKYQLILSTITTLKKEGVKNIGINFYEDIQ